MLFVVDVGNTNITYGVYDGDRLVTTFRMMSKVQHTSDEYGISMLEMLHANDVVADDLEGCIIASVVPNVMHSLTGGIIRYLNVDPMIVGAGIKTGIKIVTENPKEIGPDRIVDAVGAFEKYGGPIGQTEYIINQVRKESGYDNMKVVATGGLGRIISEETDLIQVYDSTLTLEGLRLIYLKNAK